MITGKESSQAANSKEDVGAGDCLLPESSQEEEAMEAEDVPGETQDRELFPTDSFFASGDAAGLSNLATIVSQCSLLTPRCVCVCVC